MISGHRTAVERAVAEALEQGAKLAKILPVSVPSHSPLMHKAAELFSSSLNALTLSPARLPIVSNADAQPMQEPSAVRNALLRQLYSPVRWVEIVRFLKSQDVECIVELGSGKVLTGLIKRIEPSFRLINVESYQQLQEVCNGI